MGWYVPLVNLFNVLRREEQFDKVDLIIVDHNGVYRKKKQYADVSHLKSDERGTLYEIDSSHVRFA